MVNSDLKMEVCQRTVVLNLPQTYSMDIAFNNVSYGVQMGFRGKNKELLTNVSGKFKAGELTAIMGPSGAGKSTLLNILTGFHISGNLKGEIDYVSSQGKNNLRNSRKSFCYIQQDDRLFALFTVYETMMMAAELKLGNSINLKAKNMLIDDILEMLDLSKTKETRCHHLSGGQKKRVSIALELIDNPPVMFLDEPTTGLDSASSLQCMSTLQNLARGGRTIIFTIHQPSATIYEMIDHVYLLANGRCMYAGAPRNTVAYFAKLGLQCPKYHNPADYVIEVVSQEYGNFDDQLASVAEREQNNWRSTTITAKSEKITDEAKQYSEERKAIILVNTPSEIARFWILLHRIYVQLYRDWTVTHLKLILHLFVGVLLGLLYVDAGTDGSKSLNNVGFFLVSVVYLCYTSMMPAVLKFPQELPVLKKERFNNWYKLRTYYIACLISSLPVQTFFAFAYTSVSYFLSSQPSDWNRFCMYFLMAILTAFVAESYGILLGTAVNPINGTFLGAYSTCILLAFAGFLVLFNHMPVFLYYVSYFSFLRYSMHGLAQAVYGNNREKLPCPVTYCHYRVPSTLLNELGMAQNTYWLDVVVLLSIMILLRVVAYCTLRRKLANAV